MKKILVVEDDPASRELVAETLTLFGYQVVEADNGEDALTQVHKEEPDLVLLDIEMPVMDGYAVLSQLRQDSRFASLPVLALTAYAMQGEKEKGLAAGFTAYLTKPIDARTLKTQIEKCLKETQGGKSCHSEL